jgi:hypothetical protein
LRALAGACEGECCKPKVNMPGLHSNGLEACTKPACLLPGISDRAGP